VPTRSTRPTPPSPPPPARPAGRSLVSRRALTDLVRTAVIGSYGVTGFAGGRSWERIADWLGLPPRGIRIGLEPALTIDLDLTVAHGLPIAEVARQVDSAVRYAVRRALDREVDRLTIHVDGLRTGRLEALPGGPDEPRTAAAGDRVAPDDLASSGTDVA
jgi:uncharacterized alkaline shock family protein YloU